MSNPPFKPTDEQRKQVQAMSGYGVPQADIAVVLDIDPKTLRLHFRRELDLGSVQATAKVAETLFRQATAGGNTAAMIFWMKARAGWRETQVTAGTGPNGEIITRVEYAWADGKKPKVTPP